MNGILLVDKPQGWTSFDVVNKTRAVIEHAGLNTTSKKRFPAGHAGTLDPLATGLMILLLGTATKQAQDLSKMDKTYEVTAHLGKTSTTGDEEGVKTVVGRHVPAIEEVMEAIKWHTGALQQVPPAYSAIKVEGKRAYDLARKGKAVELKPRPVTIHSIEDVQYAYPELKFTARVSSGTYIRSLVEDIGKNLKTGAYTARIRRTSIGTYDIGDALPMGQVSPDAIADHLQTLN